jgi:hypothetical protein
VLFRLLDISKNYKWLEHRRNAKKRREFLEHLDCLRPSGARNRSNVSAYCGELKHVLISPPPPELKAQQSSSNSKEFVPGGDLNASRF